MGNKLLKDPKWWIELSLNAIDLKGASAILHLTKLLGGAKLSDDTANQLVEHYNNIIHYINDKTLPIDTCGDNKNKMKLCNMYVAPTAKKRTNGNNKNSEIIDDLITGLMKNILDERNKTPIIVEGQPGHGKTSSMRILARAIQAYDEKNQVKNYKAHTVLFYEMNKLNQNLGKNVIEILQSVTPFIDDKSFFKGRKTVLILDGLDERELTDGSDKPFKDFIWNLQRLAENLPIQLIFTGRTVFINRIISQFYENLVIFGINDFTKKQIHEWLNNFNGIKEYIITEDMLDQNGLGEFKGQPLLLTIIAIWLIDQKGQIDNQINNKMSRSEIYDKIIRWSIERKHQHIDTRKFPPMDNEMDETLSKLRAIAFELFKKQTNSITTKTLESNFALYNDKIYNLTIPDRNEIKKYLGDLQVSFYFEGDTTDSFQFIHKSFADYLTVQAIIDYCQEMASIYRSDRKESSLSKMAEEVYLILGYSRLNVESHYEFLTEFKQSNRKDSNDLANILYDFLYSMNKHCYLIANAEKIGEDSYLIESTVQHNLAFLFNVLKKKTSDLSMSEWCMNYINCQCGSDMIVYLKGANLVNANLMCARLIDADLSGADLSGADLEGADLAFANFQGATFTDAQLLHANLRRTNLVGTDFEGANLEDAKFINADIRGADLRNASLINADFTGADLTGADLSAADFMSANFTGANLTGVDLSGADLEGADLRFVDLRNTDLCGANLKNVIFNYKTKWPNNCTKEKLKKFGAIKIK